MIPGPPPPLPDSGLKRAFVANPAVTSPSPPDSPPMNMQGPPTALPRANATRWNVESSQSPLQSSEMTPAPSPPPGPSPPPKPLATAAVPLAEKDVVAPGATPQYLQLPSPVYVALWATDRLVVIGAGGGGNRFGMANVLVLLELTGAAGDCHLTPPQQAAVTKGRPTAATLPSSAAATWRFVSALDLGSDIPWCISSAALPNPYQARGKTADDGVASTPWTVAQQECMGNVTSIFVISSIRSFTVVGVESTQAPGRPEVTALRQLAHITVPNDADNPDKKPVSLVRHAVLVGHDHNEIQLYDLASLLPSRRDPMGCLVPVKTAAPLAVWHLPGRVNDIAANRVNWVVAKRNPADARDVKALVMDYIVIAAAVVDKTVRLGSFRQRRNYDGHYSGSPSLVEAGTPPFTITEEVVLSGGDCGFCFPLMTSSVRMVRLFGLESPGADTSRARELLTAVSLRAAEKPAQLPQSCTIASLMVVAYDRHGNTTYIARAAIQAINVPRPADMATSGATPRPQKNAIRFMIQPEPHPSPVVKDAITCVAAYPFRDTKPNYLGSRVPEEWLGGTIEGSVISFVRSDAAAGKVDGIYYYTPGDARPSTNRRLARRFPALHRDPVTSVAISGNLDVITTDLAQNVAISSVRPLGNHVGLQTLEAQLFPRPASNPLLEMMAASSARWLSPPVVIGVVVLAVFLVLVYPRMCTVFAILQ